MRQAVRYAVLLSKPSWVLPGSSADLFFSRNGGLAAINGVPANIRSQFSASRASTGLAQWADGHLSSFAANTPRITDQGLLVEQAATNIALQSQSLQTSATWVPTAGGLGSSPTVTGNFAVAPDGTTTAARLQANLGGGTTVSDASQVRQSITVSNTTAYVGSFWLKSNTGGNFTVEIIDATSGNNAQVTVTPTWQRFQFTYTTGGTSASFRVGLQGGRTPANSNTCDILVWGGQFELGALATSYIPTTSSTATRAADVITLQGAALTAALNAKAARFVTNGIPGTASAFLGYATPGTADMFFSDATHVAIPGSSSAIAALGSGSRPGLVKSAFGFDSSSTTAIANGGTKATGGQAWPTNTSVFQIGSQSGGSSLNGYLLRVTFGPTKGNFDATTTGSNPQ